LKAANPDTLVRVFGNTMPVMFALFENAKFAFISVMLKPDRFKVPAQELLVVPVISLLTIVNV
jgi:hypothetical protein